MAKYLILKSANKSNIGIIQEREDEVAPSAKYYKFKSEQEAIDYTELDSLGQSAFIQRAIAEYEANLAANSPQKKSVEIVEGESEPIKEVEEKDEETKRVEVKFEQYVKDMQPKVDERNLKVMDEILTQMEQMDSKKETEIEVAAQKSVEVKESKPKGRPKKIN